MWARLNPTQKVGYGAIGCMLLIVAGYIGRTNLEAKPSLVVTPVKELPAAEPPTQAIEPSEVQAEVVVHVAGAVRVPGVYKLLPGSRVQDAIDMAGGPTKDALTEEVNFAAKLEDGTQLFVPRISKKTNPEEIEKVEPAYRGGESSPSPRYSRKKVAQKGKDDVPSGPVNLNTANKAQLESLPGIGPVTADRILEFRKAHGRFSSVEQLLDVQGIGPKKMAALRSKVKL